MVSPNQERRKISSPHERNTAFPKEKLPFVPQHRQNQEPLWELLHKPFVLPCLPLSTPKAEKHPSWKHFNFYN